MLAAATSVSRRTLCIMLKNRNSNKNLKKREIYWLIGTFIIIVLLNILFFGFDGLKAESTVDLNFHDTYFVIENLHFNLLLFVVVFFGIYLVRTLKSNFKNFSANIILIISTILLSLILGRIYSLVDNFIQQSLGWNIYPPLSSEKNLELVKREANVMENFMVIFSNIVLALQIMLMIFLTYCGFKTGQNFNKIK